MEADGHESTQSSRKIRALGSCIPLLRPLRSFVATHSRWQANCETHEQKGPIDGIRSALQSQFKTSIFQSMTSATFTDVDRFVAALGFEHQDQQQIADRHGCWHVSRKL